MSEPYDRMNPDQRLIDRLDEYSEIDHGTEAYSLSRAEAAFIIFLMGEALIKVKGLETELEKEKLHSQTIKAQSIGVAMNFDQINSENKFLKEKIAVVQSHTREAINKVLLLEQLISEFSGRDK